MALATNILVDGEWTTRTFDVNSILRHHDQQDRDAASNIPEVEEAPKLGLLTQTVIRSPLVHWILPARLRDNSKHDVAFIGDDFVQIKELRADGILHDVLRKDDFGARIRNARVVGSIKEYEADPDVLNASTHVKAENNDEDTQMSDGSHREPTLPGADLPFPPQWLLLQLDTGDSVFLIISCHKDGKTVFISSKRRVSRSMLKLQPGMHLAVDPSSRFMAVGCSEGVFAIYGLRHRQDLTQQYKSSTTLQHIKAETQIFHNGVILKMEFLYPAPNDDKHVILLVLALVKGKIRMLLYEWDSRHNLKEVTARSSKGYLLEKAREAPLLLIPLTIKSSFILVYETLMAVCQGILEGSPHMTHFQDRVDTPTPFHHGSGRPLWTAWARPSRLESHKVTRDDLFIAREDGLVKFLEIDAEDEDAVTADNNVGELGTNCGTALASLDYPNRKDNRSGDLFIVGGDASSGGMYLLQARKSPVLTQAIPNWSPAHDFVTTYKSQATPGELVVSGVVSRPNMDSIVPKPDRIFACVGKGSKGGVTELRNGFEASIGLEVDYESIIMDAWALSPSSETSNEMEPHVFLLSLGDRTAVLQLALDASEIVELEGDATKLDLTHRTVTAVAYGQYIIQVTEKTLVVTNNSTTDHLYRVNDLLRTDQGEVAKRGEWTIDNAAVQDGFIFFTTRLPDANHSAFLHILELQLTTSDMEMGNEPAIRSSYHIEHDISAIATGGTPDYLVAVMAGWSRDNSVVLTFVSTDGYKRDVITPSTCRDTPSRLDTITSIVFLPTVAGVYSLVCGTRRGTVTLFEISRSTFDIVSSISKRIGETPARVSKDEFPSFVYPASEEIPSSEYPVFVTCDSQAYILTFESRRSHTQTWSSFRIDHIWLSDALKPGLQQPKVNSIVRMRPPQTGSSSGSLLLISGSQLLITGLSANAKLVARHLPVGGTPTRILYSHRLNVLVVATSLAGKSSLLFIDPITGQDISQPLDEKTKEDVPFASGLGNTNERIFRLFEWLLTKESKIWYFIIAATSTGRLLIISVEERQHPGHDDPSLAGCRQLCYYTRYKFKSTDPVYSATGLSDGLLWGTGTALSYDVLDLDSKKFKRVATYDLPSPAIDIMCEDDTIYALTSGHSLEILKLELMDDGGRRIIRTHGDQIARASLHQLRWETIAQRPIHLVSDKLSSVVGLWPTRNAKADTLEPVFEAGLHSSIIRFRFGRCRPAWDPTWSEDFQTSTSFPVTKCDALGLSITGSLTHFALLDFNTWKFLRFVMDLANRSKEICEFTYRDDPMPLDTMDPEPNTMMHIDGDVLRTILNKRALQALLCQGVGLVDVSRILKTFTTLLEDVHGETLEKEQGADYYIAQAYEDLEFYLRPVV